MLNSEYFKEYESVSENIKFITNSKIRLKILATLYNKPSAMKDIHLSTSLSYSSISSNISKLEEKKLVYRESNIYFLNNDIKLYLMFILDFNKSLLFINEFSSLFMKHNISNFPRDLLNQLYLLEDSELIESSKNDIYRPYDTIKNILNKESNLKIVLPFYYHNLINSISSAVENNNSVEIILSKNIASNFKENSLNNNVKCFKVEENSCFSLFLSNKSMALGLFKKEGSYDQNRILYSENKNSLIWAENLFNNTLLKNSLNP